MYAVIRTGGKQYRVKEGDILDVEKLEAASGQPMDFDQVLLIETEDKVLLGTPTIANAVVRATAVEVHKDDKILVFKKKRRKQYRRTRGHRQQLLRVRIDEIVPDVAQAPERKPVKPVEKPAPKPAPAPKPVKEVAAVKVEEKKAAKKPAPAAKPVAKPKVEVKPAKKVEKAKAKEAKDKKRAAKPKKVK